MSAVLTGMQNFEHGQKAVLLRSGEVLRGTLFALETPLEDDPCWLLKLDGTRAVHLTLADTVYTESTAPCFACARLSVEGCRICFDGYL